MSCRLTNAFFGRLAGLPALPMDWRPRCSTSSSQRDVFFQLGSPTTDSACAPRPEKNSSPGTSDEYTASQAVAPSAGAGAGIFRPGKRRFGGSARGTLQLTQPSWYDDSSASALASASASASASAVEKRSVPNARAKHPSSTGQPNATTNAAVASGQASKVTNRMRISDFAFFTDRPCLVNSSAGACLGPHARQASQ